MPSHFSTAARDILNSTQCWADCWGPAAWSLCSPHFGFLCLVATLKFFVYLPPINNMETHQQHTVNVSHRPQCPQHPWMCLTVNDMTQPGIYWILSLVNSLYSSEIYSPSRVVTLKESLCRPMIIWTICVDLLCGTHLPRLIQVFQIHP